MLYVGAYCVHCDHFGDDYYSPFTTGEQSMEFLGPNLEAILPWIPRVNNEEMVQYLLWETLLNFAHRFGTQYDLDWGEHDRLHLIDLQTKDAWNTTVNVAKICRDHFACPDRNISIIKDAIRGFF